MSDSSLRLERLSDIGYLNIRGDASSPEFLAAVKDATGVAVPVVANSVTGSDSKIYWMGPDEWLLVGKSDEIANCRATLLGAVQEQHVAVNDLSGGLVTYRLVGASARQLLSTGCTLDLHPRVFDSGGCAQTGLAKAGVLLSVLDVPESFEITVRRSFADYVWQWLATVGGRFGIEVA